MRGQLLVDGRVAPVKLTTSAGAAIDHPTAEDIARALGDLPLTADYEALIARDRDHFIQARTDPALEAEEGSGEGIMLHALDGKKHMFEATSRHAPATVIRVFQLYAQGNPQWKQEIAWQEFAGAGSRLLILAGVIVAVFLVWRLLGSLLLK